MKHKEPDRIHWLDIFIVGAIIVILAELLYLNSLGATEAWKW